MQRSDLAKLNVVNCYSRPKGFYRLRSNQSNPIGRFFFILGFCWGSIRRIRVTYMQNKQINLTKKLLEIRDISGFSAEFLIQKLHCIEDKQDQDLIYALCGNLHRASLLMEAELLDRGIDCENRPYSHQSFNNVKHLDVDLIEEVKKNIEQKKRNQQIINSSEQTALESV